MRTLRLALAQINPTVGDLKGNAEKIIDYIRKAEACSADIVAFPELAVTGYPPEDLLLKPQFIKDNQDAIKIISKEVRDLAAIIGFVDKKDGIYNAAAVIYNKAIVDVYHKIYLPNYGVFDEHRYFQPGTGFPVYDIAGVPVGVNICEDIWYPEGPSHIQSLCGAEVILNINASPYHIGKTAFREKMLATRAMDNSAVIAYLNTVGGQDELVFDGHSLVLNEQGEIICRGEQFKEDLIFVDLDLSSVFKRRLHMPRNAQKAAALNKPEARRIVVSGERTAKKRKPLPERENKSLKLPEEVYNALVLGTSDYVRKNAFNSAVIGLSGGVDSSLVAAIAVDALGRDNVKALFMPSPYTSNESKADASALTGNLGIELIVIPITGIFDTFLAAVKGHFKGHPPDVAEENMQARIRGTILMAFSNKFKRLVLTTGNKSEMSVGYATLYGDMAGGFAVIKDVSKTMVYELCKWINKRGKKALIPESVLVKAPSAELKPDQRDTDVLPPYNVLDPILKLYVEEERSFQEMLSGGYDTKLVKKIVNMVDRSEYKRRQSPPGIKITQRAFGRDWRFPITNKYRSC